MSDDGHVLQDAVRRWGPPWFDRAVVVESTPSTQDAAFDLSESRPGLVLMAKHQTAGRGRRGKTWHDHPSHSLAMTMVLPRTADGSLAVRIGVGVMLGLEHLSADAVPRIGLLWPNDIVAREGESKVGGILIEGRGDVTCVGIGINVGHARTEFDDRIGSRATSLTELGLDTDRLSVASALVRGVAEAMGLAPSELGERFSRADVVSGTDRRFTVDGRAVWGRVESIDIQNHVRLIGPDGNAVRIRVEDASLTKP